MEPTYKYNTPMATKPYSPKSSKLPLSVCSGQR